MAASGVEASEVTYKATVAACEKAGKWEAALQLFDATLQTKGQCNTIVCNSAINACKGIVSGSRFCSSAA